MLLHRDPFYPGMPLRQFCAGELQTAQELYLATTMENNHSRTVRLHVTVIRASDNQRVSYRAISSLRRRQDGTFSHRVNVTGLGGFSTVGEAIQGVLAHEAARQEARMVCLTNPMFEPAKVALQAGQL